MAWITRRFRRIWWTIAAGATSNTIVITPIEQPAAVSAVKTVVLTLTNSPLLTPVNYEIGSPSSATVYLAGSGATNLPPSVSIIEPKDGSVFYTPTNIQFLAKAIDPDGSVTHVEFFAGSNDLGTGLHGRARSTGRQRCDRPGLDLQLA